MKKTLFIIILAMILGGTAFFFGWAQLTVPPGSYGVLRSKTHGLDSQPIKEGEFRWIWYKLLPTNAEILNFTLGPVRRSIASSGSLGSGQIYADFVGMQADFSWEISGELEFSVKPDYLPELVGKENILDDAGLRSFEARLGERIETAALQRLKIYADEDEKKMESLILAGSLPELTDELRALFPEAENLNCTIKVARYPDYALYQSVKALYREYLARQSAALSPGVAGEADQRVAVRMRMNELAAYGELLVKYPVLLQYLALEKGFMPAAADRAPSGER